MGPFLVICGGNIAWIGVDVSLVLAPDEARLQTYQAEKSTSLVDMGRVSRLEWPSRGRSNDALLSGRVTLCGPWMKTFSS